MWNTSNLPTISLVNIEPLWVPTTPVILVVPSQSFLEIIKNVIKITPFNPLIGIFQCCHCCDRVSIPPGGTLSLLRYWFGSTIQDTIVTAMILHPIQCPYNLFVSTYFLIDVYISTVWGCLQCTYRWDNLDGFHPKIYLSISFYGT